MTERLVTVSEARRDLAAVIQSAREGHAPVFIARRGRRVAAIVDADDLDTVMGLAEDMIDIRAAQAARDEMRETGGTPVPWDEVKADLGLA